jgi:ABC-2 type transport system permease protein
VTRLVVAELRRLGSRRLTWIAAVLLLLGVGLFQLLVSSEVSPPSATEVAQNQRYLKEARQDWRENHVELEQECRDSGTPADQCAYPEPSEADYGLAPTPFADIAGIAVTLSALLALFASYLVSASSIGAEYTSGAIANWLTFVPERLKVFGSKLVAVVVLSAVLGAVTTFAMLGLVAGVTRFYGGDLTGLGDLAATSGRAVVLVVLAGVAGFCIGLVSRHTVAALGVVLGYLIVGSVLRPLSTTVPALQWLPPWLPDYNLLAFLEHGTTYLLQTSTTTIEGTEYSEVEKHLSFGHSAAYWSVLLVVAVVGAALVFRRRDVT